MVINALPDSYLSFEEIQYFVINKTGVEYEIDYDRNGWFEYNGSGDMLG